tara:strand:+ start:1847 stop:3106 length:1260 start_codon:yes stop_codon:yes gene_type:complete
MSVKIFKPINKQPLFCGLTHIGQVFSIGWSEKIGKCSVFDFNNKSLKKFQNYKVTNEEPSLLKYLKKNIKKIKFCNSSEEIKEYENVFLTIDTPLKSNGNPKVKKILNSIKKIKKYLGYKSNLIIISQVYCGFCENLKKKIFKDRKDINIIYFTDTLVMGNALDRFINPERIILGYDKKVEFLNKFKKFNCKIYNFSTKQAEMVKIAINLFLFNSVSFANMMDYYCRQFGFRFSDINNSIKDDKRIGKKSYISPSLGVSGGHLERDVFTIKKYIKNKNIKKIFSSLKNINQNRISLLINKFKQLYNLKKYKKVVWIGPSYKTKSFSTINSPYTKFDRFVKKFNNKIKLYVFDSFFDLKNEKISNYLTSIKHSNFKNSFVIFNYANLRDTKILEKFAKNKKCDVLNINFEKKNYKNFINY